MFDRFQQLYKITSRAPAHTSDLISRNPMEDTPGYVEFMREYAGATFNNGVYRVHTLENRAKWDRLIAEVFPQHEGRFRAFAYDWAGSQFALDFHRRDDGQPLVLLFDPGFGEALQIPATFYNFHEQVLVTDSEAALEDKVYKEWLNAGNRAPGPTECVGYKVSLFLGGRDQLDNCELVDMEVYWVLTGQLLKQTRNLPDGTPIGEVKIE